MIRPRTVGELREFLRSFTDECPVYHFQFEGEDGEVNAYTTVEVTYTIEDGYGAVQISPGDHLERRPHE